MALKRSVVLSNHTTEEIDLWNIDLKVPEKSGYTYDRNARGAEAGGGVHDRGDVAADDEGPGAGRSDVQHSGRRDGAGGAEGVLQPPPEEAKGAEGKVELSPEALDFGTSPGGMALKRSVVLSNARRRI